VDAYEFAATGAAIVIEEANLLPGIFFTQLKNILADADLRAKMSAASSAFFIPGATDKIADGLMRMGAR
jgi:UDP-N-acetylglucosamine:LPS N-acetylglucosamine transferase